MATGNVELSPSIQQLKHSLEKPLEHSSPTASPSDNSAVLLESSFTPLDEFLTIPLSEVVDRIPRFHSSPQPLVVSHTETIEEVLKKLNEYRVRCAVVARYEGHWGINCPRRAPVECPDGPTVVVKQQMLYTLSIRYSFFDVRDLCYYVVRLYQEFPCRSVEDVLDLVRKEKVGKVANISARLPFFPKQLTDSVGSIICAFGPCCRIPIFERNRLVKIMTPSDLLHLLMTGGIIQQIERKQNVDIRSLSKRDVMTIGQTESLLKAVSLMERHGYSAIPIVSDQNLNQALDVITVKDIKLLLTAPKHFEGKDVLNAPALSYVRVLRKPTDQSTAEWAFISDRASLDELFALFAKTNAHRLVLHNDAGRMSGLLSLSDMMRQLAEFTAPYSSSAT